MHITFQLDKYKKLSIAKRLIISPIHKVKKIFYILKAICTAIENIETLQDGSILIQTKAGIIINPNGHILLGSQNYDIILKGRFSHIQPNRNPYVENLQLNEYNQKIIIDNIKMSEMIDQKNHSTINFSTITKLKE